MLQKPLVKSDTWNNKIEYSGQTNRRANRPHGLEDG